MATRRSVARWSSVSAGLMATKPQPHMISTIFLNGSLIPNLQGARMKLGDWHALTDDAVEPSFSRRRQASRDGTSRMNRGVPVRICEGLGVKFSGPARQQGRSAVCGARLATGRGPCTPNVTERQRLPLMFDVAGASVEGGLTSKDCGQSRYRR
jgi:hypothetical protein